MESWFEKRKKHAKRAEKHKNIEQARVKIKQLKEEIAVCEQCKQEAIVDNEGAEYITYFSRHIKEKQQEIRGLKDSIIGYSPIKHNTFAVSVLAFIGIMLLFFLSMASTNNISGHSIVQMNYTVNNSNLINNSVNDIFIGDNINTISNPVKININAYTTTNDTNINNTNNDNINNTDDMNLLNVTSNTSDFVINRNLQLIAGNIVPLNYSGAVVSSDDFVFDNKKETSFLGYKYSNTSNFIISSIQQNSCNWYPDDHPKKDLKTCEIIIEVINKNPITALELTKSTLSFSGKQKNVDYSLSTEYVKYKEEYELDKDNKINVSRKKWGNFKTMKAAKPLNTNFSINAVFDMPKYETEQFNITLDVKYQGINIQLNLDPDVGVCGTLSSAGVYTLNQSINSNGTCFTFGANGIALDGAGYAITGNSTGNGIATAGYDNITIKNFGGINNYSVGISASGTINSTISNNTIVAANVSSAVGIYLFSSSSNNTLINNNITMLGATTAYGILLQSSSINNVMSGNTIKTFGTDGYGILLQSSVNIMFANNITTLGTGAYGIYLSASSNNNLSNNIINTTGSTNAYGIYTYSSSNNNVILSNIISTSGSSGSNYGIRSNLGSNNNTVSHNTINTYSSSGIAIFSTASLNNTFSHNIINTTNTNSYGFSLTTTNNTVVYNNTIITTGSSTSNGMTISASNNDIISSNTITTSGTNYGILLQTASFDNAFSNNVITSTSTNAAAYGVYLEGGINNTFTNDNITSVVANDIRIASGSGTFTNVTFNRTDIGFDSGAKGNVTVKWYVISNLSQTNGAALSSANVSGYNISNIIEQTAITGSNGLATLTLTEFEQNATLKLYHTPHSINASLAGYIANSTSVNLTVTGSTSVVLSLTPICRSLTSSYTLDQNVDSNGTCITFGANSIVLDGAGYTITGNSTGNGITTAGYDNITVKNFGGINNYSLGIFASGTVNSTIFNNTIFPTAKAGFNYGISLASSSNSNNISNNKINITGGTDRGIDLVTSSNNNIISLNDITSSNANGYGIAISASTNNILANTITTTNTNGFGIYLHTSANNNNLSANTITTSGSTSHGIRFDVASHNVMSANTIKTTSATTAYGVYLVSGGTNNTFTNDNITATGVNDIRIASGSGTFINVTFNITDIGFDSGATGNLTVKWYLTTNVQNTSGNNLQNANVSVYNNSDAMQASDLTNSNGITIQTLTDFYQDNASKTFYTPHIVNATLSGYNANSTTVNISSTKSTGITLTLVNTPPSVIFNTPSIGYYNSNFVINATVTDIGGGSPSVVFYRYENSTTNGTYTQMTNSAGNYWNATFNISLVSNGNYTIRINATDINGNSNLTATVANIAIDTINPTLSYTTNTESDNTYFNRTWIFVNVSANDTNEVNITFFLYNSTAQVNATTSTAQLRAVNFTGLNSNEQYYYNVTLTDIVGNRNSTDTRKLTLDSTVPAISYGANIDENNTYFNRTWIFINVSANDINEANITFFLYNSTAQVNATTSTAQLRAVNFTGLNSNEQYYYNVTLTDFVGNRNSTDTRKLTLDSTVPALSYTTNTESNNTYFNRTWIFVNVSANDTNEANITFFLYNSTAQVNATTSTVQLRAVNFTGLNSNEQYYYNVTLTDLVGNRNPTDTRKLTLDSIMPAISYGANIDENNTYFNRTWIFVNVSVNEINEANITFFLYNSTAQVNATTSTTQLRAVNFTGLNSNEQYYYNVTLTDFVGNRNSTDTRKLTLDSTVPALSYTTNTESDNTYFNRTWIFVNVSVNEINEANITFFLYNSTAQVNATTSTAQLRAVNFTGLNSNEQYYYYNVSVQDSAGNLNTTVARKITLDSIAPSVNIIFPINGSSLSSVQLNRTFNWSVSDVSLSVCMYSLNHAANITVPCLQNYTNITTVAKVQNNITFYVNDSTGSMSSASIIFRMNTNPSIPELVSPANATEKIYNNLTFIWNASTDSDGDILTYEIVLGNDSSFTRQLHNATTSNTNYTNVSIYQDGMQYWKVRAYDSFEYSNYSEARLIDLIKAVINITAPAYNSVVYPAVTYTITVKELNRTEWIRNVTVQVLNDDIEAVEQANLSSDNLTWVKTYTVPISLTPRTLTVIARAYNWTTYNYTNYTNTSGSPSESINATSLLKVTRIEGVAVSAPTITKLIPDPTNQLPNLTVNISLIVDLDTLLDTITLNLTKPDNSSILLTANQTLDNSTAFIYYRNYTIIPDQLGIYTAKLTVIDINSQSANTSTAFRIANLVNHTLNKTNAINIKLIDINTKNTIVANVSNQSTIIPGQYDVEITTAKPTITFFNSTVNETVKYVLNYTDLDENIAPPSGRRSAETFQIVSELAFSSGNVTFNYSPINASIVEPSNLEMYKCSSVSSCDWQKLTVSVDTTDKLITGIITNLSLFMVAEPTSPTTQTVFVSSGGGGATLYVQNKSIVTKAETLSLKIIVPSLLMLSSNESITTPVIIRNTGNLPLDNIGITSAVNTKDLSTKLDKTNILKLEKNAQESVMLTISSHTDPGRYEITLRAVAYTQNIEDTAKIYIDLTEKNAGNKTNALSLLEFAKDLFNKNPECLELTELLKQSEASLANKDYQKAEIMIDSAINACKELASLVAVRVEAPSKVNVLNRFKLYKLNSIIEDIKIKLNEKLPVLGSLTAVDLGIIIISIILISGLVVYAFTGNKKRKKGR